MSRTTRLVLAFLALVLVAACSSDSDAVPTTEATTTRAPTTAADDTVATTGETATTTTTVAETTTTVPPKPIVLPGLERIEISSPSSGDGPRPELAWEPLEGADHYALILYTPDEVPYWSWQGFETAIPVGGLPRLDDDAPGPSVIEGMSWTVFAYDEAGIPVGSSPRTPIGP